MMGLRKQVLLQYTSPLKCIANITYKPLYMYTCISTFHIPLIIWSETDLYKLFVISKQIPTRYLFEHLKYIEVFPIIKYIRFRIEVKITVNISSMF